MSELCIDLENYDPLEIFGCDEEKLNLIKKYFPQIKIILRGHWLKALGDEKHLSDFEEKIKCVFVHYDKLNRLTSKDIADILGENSSEEKLDKTLDLEQNSKGLILIGNNGRHINFLNPNQGNLVKACGEKDMVFAIGPAGSGKTYTAVAVAVAALKNKEVKRIILTRPAVEAGENLGFLPGDLKEKLDPYMQPLYDALKDMLPYQKLLSYMEEGTIEIAPLAYMRGRTLDNAFVILDEAQNATESQMKMFLTRMGKAAKFVVTGDITQIDLPNKQNSGLLQAQRLLKKIKEIAFIYLTADDVVRHPIVAKILKAYEKDA